MRKIATTALLVLGVLGLLFLAALAVPSVRHKLNIHLTWQEQWQTVFLSNGEIYVGHLRYAQSDTPVLTNVYILTVNNAKSSGDPSQIDRPDFFLNKISNALHSPEDTLMLNRDHILYWEDLQKESKVVQTLNGSQTQ